MKKSHFIPFTDVDLNNGFWKSRYDLNRTVSLGNVRLRFEESGRFDALRFNFLKTGRAPHIFFDSDAAKWMEAVAYLIAKDPDGMREHEALCDELIDCMEHAQRPDGYLNSTHQQISPDRIFQDRGRHELYCAGHLIEAAIAYQNATGKDRFLKIMERYCDCIEHAFITEKTAAFTTPGHEEIELALFKLYRHTGNEKYKRMAEFFLSNRGKTDTTPCDWYNIYAAQDDVDIEHLREANGHSVRALYLYSGIADMALENENETLYNNLEQVFEDITERKMYITGGVGSTRIYEGFTVPYDLPNHTSYSESCCAIAFMLFASRMRRMAKKATYGHLMERVLYNSMLSSTSLDGKAFFYENPLEISLPEYDREIAAPRDRRERLPITQRLEVFGCSCCPPNINRFFAEFGSYLCVDDGDSLCVEQYVSSDIRSSHGTLQIRERYAVTGQVEIASEDYTAKTISFRVPEWCRTCSVSVNGKETNVTVTDGYITLPVSNRFSVALDFHIAPRFVSANPKVRADAGRIALCYGPVVYCLEGIDNGEFLNSIEIDPAAVKQATFTEEFHSLLSISLPAYRSTACKQLYFDASESTLEPVTVKLIPYFAFANRGESDMLVWIRRH